MKQKSSLSFWKLWNLSFGFFGVQIAYALQNANISRIFATLGSDPHSLSYFWKVGLVQFFCWSAFFSVQAIGSVVWAAVLPQFKNTKVAYAVSLLLGPPA